MKTNKRTFFLMMINIFALLITGLLIDVIGDPADFLSELKSLMKKKL